MRIFRRILLVAFLTVTILVIVGYVWVKLTPFSPGNSPILQNGDLVFQSSKTHQSMAIAFASASFYTHVGIIKISANGQPWVVEAVGPVRETPLNDWVIRGIGERITIARINNLTSPQAAQVLNEAKKYYGLPYDFYFLPDDEHIYCSELIYKSFKRGASIDIGKLEKVKDLRADNLIVRKLIERRWRSDPICKNMEFAECYNSIMNQELVTPDSIEKDNKVKIIYSNYGFLK